MIRAIHPLHLFNLVMSIAHGSLNGVVSKECLNIANISAMGDEMSSTGMAKLVSCYTRPIDPCFSGKLLEALVYIALCDVGIRTFKHILPTRSLPFQSDLANHL